MIVRLVTRVYVNNALHSEDRIECEFEALQHLLPNLATKHALLSLGGQPIMIEIEFLDEPDENERFFRIGTDPRRMVLPVPINDKADA